MANVTYHDHTLGTTPDGTEDVPVWQASGAKRLPLDAFRELRHNPTAITAATGGQGGATALSLNFDEFNVTTIASPGFGTKFIAIPAYRNVTFKIIRVAGAAANHLTHYPASGGKFNDQAVDTPITIERGNAALFYSISALNWNTIP